MSTGSVAFLSAILGALVGGIATAVGTYLLQRHQHILSVRVAIYRDLLPQAEPSLAKVLRVVTENHHYGGSYAARGGNGLADRLDPVIRAARTGGSLDRRHARRIEAAVDALGIFHDDKAAPQLEIDPNTRQQSYPAHLADEVAPLVRRLNDEVDAYREGIESRF